MQPPDSTRRPGNANSESTKSRSAVLRFVVYGSLAAAALLVYLERDARQEAVATGDAWRNVIEQKDRKSERNLRQSELAGYIVGKPSVTRSDPTKSSSEARVLETYTWSGPFRDYSVVVYLGDVQTYIGHGDDWPVLSAEGPMSGEW